MPISPCLRLGIAVGETLGNRAGLLGADLAARS